ncbi:hypothetical protein [Bacillus sp. 2205SS5-2]|uniref:hypothetical protein n=1 Tax=Bacillus sp. 2205SS5-2 TaxID=3109031 RepID=UPI003004BDB1
MRIQNKMRLSFILSFSFILLVACNSDDSAKDSLEKEGETTQVEDNEVNKEPENKPVELDDEGNQNALATLKPTENIIKTFNQNDEYTLTESIVDMNDTYIQRVFEIGDMVTLQVLKWNEDIIQVVYEESDPESPRESILHDFTSNKEMHPIVDITHKGTGDSPIWEIVSEDETIEVPYQKFQGVYKVKSTVSAGSGQAVNTIYFAPGIGMIKEVFEETGEDGYIIESVLEEVESL